MSATTYFIKRSIRDIGTALAHPLITAISARETFGVLRDSLKDAMRSFKQKQLHRIGISNFMTQYRFTLAEQRQVAKILSAGIVDVIPVGGDPAAFRSIMLITRIERDCAHYRIVRAKPTDDFPARVDKEDRIRTDPVFIRYGTDTAIASKAYLIGCATRSIPEDGHAELFDFFRRPAFG